MREVNATGKAACAESGRRCLAGDRDDLAWVHCRTTFDRKEGAHEEKIKTGKVAFNSSLRRSVMLELELSS